MQHQHLAGVKDALNEDRWDAAKRGEGTSKMETKLDAEQAASNQPEGW